MAEMRYEDGIIPEIRRIMRESQNLKPLPLLSPLPTPDEIRSGKATLEAPAPVTNVPAPTRQFGVPSQTQRVDNEEMRDDLLNNLRSLFNLTDAQTQRVQKTINDAKRYQAEKELEAAQLKGVKAGQADVLNKTLQEDNTLDVMEELNRSNIPRQGQDDFFDVLRKILLGALGIWEVNTTPYREHTTYEVKEKKKDSNYGGER